MTTVSLLPLGTRSGRHQGLLARLSVALVVYNSALNVRPPPTRVYVGVNLAATGGLLALGRARGLSWTELGLDPASVGPGMRQGGVVAAVTGTALAAAVAAPATRRLLLDRRVAGIGAPELLSRMLVRVPLGTVALEEAAFRGVLLAAWARRGTPRAAVAGSSAVFGLWHVGPTLQLLRLNAPGAGAGQRLLGVAAGTAATGLAGVGLCALRQRGGGLIGPGLAHAAVNALSTAASFAAHRLCGRGRPSR
ncbi:MAG: CPBP family intramembrane metalloprotease [Actinomycetota bacterium]|nr:CPBP family intramembrane metalloprotease [Actinomycetota bacterium]